MLRKTKQRAAIMASFRKAGRPLSAIEIHQHGRRLAPALGLRTVYRNIREMVEEGHLVGLDYPGQPPRYELVEGRHHPHFICRHCNKVFDFVKEAPDVAYTPPPGFTIEGEEVIFFGSCPTCSTKKNGREKNLR